MKLRPTSPGTEYLKRNLLPLIDGIKPKTTDSWIAEICGCDDIVSTQSIFISMGGRIEKFWNKVIGVLMRETTRVITGVCINCWRVISPAII